MNTILAALFLALLCIQILLAILIIGGFNFAVWRAILGRCLKI